MRLIFPFADDSRLCVCGKAPHGLEALQSQLIEAVTQPGGPAAQTLMASSGPGPAEDRVDEGLMPPACLAPQPSHQAAPPARLHLQVSGALGWAVGTLGEAQGSPC